MYLVNFNQISNRETWSQAIKVVDEQGNDADISAATISVAIRRTDSPPDDAVNLDASVGDGVTVVSPIFTFLFSETDMNGLDPGFHNVGITVTISGVTTQLIKGTVYIVDGVVA